jgi:hypothetical protein
MNSDALSDIGIEYSLQQERFSLIEKASGVSASASIGRRFFFNGVFQGVLGFSGASLLVKKVVDLTTNKGGALVIDPVVESIAITIYFLLFIFGLYNSIYLYFVYKKIKNLHRGIEDSDSLLGEAVGVINGFARNLHFMNVELGNLKGDDFFSQRTVFECTFNCYNKR